MENEETKQSEDYGESRNTLVLTTLSSIILGFIVPLIIWAVNKEKMQEGAKKYLTSLLNFELTLLVTGIILTVINVIPILGQLVYALGGILICITNAIVLIIAVFKLGGNLEYKFPFTYQFLK